MENKIKFLAYSAKAQHLPLNAIKLNSTFLLVLLAFAVCIGILVFIPVLIGIFTISPPFVVLIIAVFALIFARKRKEAEKPLPLLLPAVRTDDEELEVPSTLIPDSSKLGQGSDLFADVVLEEKTIGELRELIHKINQSPKTKILIVCLRNNNRKQLINKILKHQQELIMSNKENKPPEIVEIQLTKEDVSKLLPRIEKTLKDSFTPPKPPQS